MRPLAAVVLARAFSWLTERLYYELAWAYDAVAWVVSLGQWSRWRRVALPYLGGGRVLEVGFGTGELLLGMRQRGIAATGVDRSPAMQRVTRRKARRRRVETPVVRADARALPFASGSFAAVVATFPAAYVLAPGFMAEAARVLADDGRLVVAGLYVESSSPFLKLVAWLVSGSGVRRVEARFDEVAAGAGFAVRRIVAGGRGFRLPVFVLTKESVATTVVPAAAHESVAGRG